MLVIPLTSLRRAMMDGPATTKPTRNELLRVFEKLPT